jgi:hypothetical protein
MLRKQLTSVSLDAKELEYPISGLNRIRSMDPPSDWDDIPTSACREMNFRNKT